MLLSKNGGNLRKLMLNRHMCAPCRKGEIDAAKAQTFVPSWLCVSPEIWPEHAKRHRFGSHEDTKGMGVHFQAMLLSKNGGNLRKLTLNRHMRARVNAHSTPSPKQIAVGVICAHAKPCGEHIINKIL
jgi:hypothetical protein